MAGGTITTGNIPRLVVEGLNKVFGQTYDEHPTEWTNLFEMETSRKAFELDQQYEGFGPAPVKPEGQDIDFDTATQGYTPQYQHLTYAKGFIVTKEALNDELYGVFRRRARALAFSMRQTQEVVCANVYNRAHSSSYTMSGGDGKALLATDHPLGPSGGTFSNKLGTPADLSQASLEALLNQIGQAVDARGNRIAVTPERLIVPVAEQFNATRIMNSVLQSDSSTNAVNAVRDMNSIAGGFVTNHYLTSDKAWFIKTNTGGGEGMKFFRRQEVEYGEDMSFTSGNGRYKADERYSAGWSDARGLYGSEGT